jgi:hypothetical protein
MRSKTTAPVVSMGQMAARVTMTGVTTMIRLRVGDEEAGMGKVMKIGP